MPNRSYQAVARSEIKKMALAIGLSAKRMAELEIVVSEITSNVAKHTAGGAELLVKIIEGSNPGIEIICVDGGPGMESAERMMEDGISSTNTLGHGLGAIRRLSDEFDLYSLPGWGTILLSRFFKQVIDKEKRSAFSIGVLMLAKDGEQVSGDDYYYLVRGNNLRIAVCDGLGHGKDAHAAAVGCLQVYQQHVMTNPCELIRKIHELNKRTRGAVIYTMHIDFTNKQVTYCGVGNISAKILSAAKPKFCISYNGIVGHSVPGVINNHVLQCNKSDLFIIHSDGLTSRWDIAKYPNITKHDRSIIAAALYKDFNRKTDDVTIAVISQANRAV